MGHIVYLHGAISNPFWSLNYVVNSLQMALLYSTGETFIFQ